jgi:hypothetical protein
MIAVAATKAIDLLMDRLIAAAAKHAGKVY